MSARQGLCFGALGAALAAAVAVVRAQQGAGAFLILFGGAALFFGPALAFLSAARPLTAPLRAVLVGLGLSAVPVAKLASLLKATTHHRPLGAVTFAAAALVLCFAAIAVSARLLAIGEGGRSSNRAVRISRVALLAAAVLGPSLLLVQAAVSANLRGGVFEVALGLGAGALVRLLPWPPQVLRGLELSAVPIWLGAVLTGIVSGLVLGGGAAELASPALAAPISWLLR